jgi:hypothetical protein
MTVSELLSDASVMTSRDSVRHGAHKITRAKHHRLILSEPTTEALLKENCDLRVALEMCVNVLEKFKHEDNMDEDLYAYNGALGYANFVLHRKLSNGEAK